MENFEKSISNLIETQFPQFYRTDGPVFIEFLKKYYEWMETSQAVSKNQNLYYGLVVKAKNPTLIGNNLELDKLFANGDQIALYRDETNYDLFTIDTVSSNSIELNSNYLPEFSSSNTRYDTVTTKYNPLYYSRNIYDNMDIDLTTDNFIVYFKEKYLKNIKFETAFDKRLLIKHILDLYRSKGSERAVDLLFKIVFGVEPEIYYPSKDLFKLSSGKWKSPQYLEVSLGETSPLFVNKQIRGLNSGATAFVESVIRKTIGSKFIDVIYISALNGDFQTGEKINLSNVPLDVKICPTVIGSLTRVELPVDGSGENFNIGNTVTITSNKGKQALGRVANVATPLGIVDIFLENGGFGYSNSAQVIISDKVITISNLEVSNTSNYYFAETEQIIQPTASLYYINGSNNFANNTNVYTYYANGQQKGFGYILDTLNVNSSAGYLTVSIRSGSLNDNAIYSTSNTISANLDILQGYTNTTSSANIIGWSNNVTLYLSNSNFDYTIGDHVYQNDSGIEKATGQVLSISSVIGSNVVIGLTNAVGVFHKHLPVLSKNNVSHSANIYSITIDVGLEDEINGFTIKPNNYFYTTNSLSNGSITQTYQGFGANFEISPALLYSETLFLNLDYLKTYANVALSGNYGFPKLATANLATPLEDALTYENIEFGKISGLLNINKGLQYNKSPFIKVLEPIVYPYNKRDYILEVISSNFAVGELIYQPSSNAYGLIKTGSNTTTLKVERLNLINEFTETIDANSMISSETSGFSANVVLVLEDTLSDYIGYNATINNEVKSGNNAIVALDIIDSGFGYEQNEEVTISDGTNFASGFAKLEKQGRSKGYYKDRNGFISSTKKLRDGFYYQEFSYEIRSSITLNKYEEMLKKILHIAGTKFFGAWYYDTVGELPVKAHTSVTKN